MHVSTYTIYSACMTLRLETTDILGIIINIIIMGRMHILEHVIMEGLSPLRTAGLQHEERWGKCMFYSRLFTCRP